MATNPDISPSDRASESFKKLAESAARLNSASDELASAIQPIDFALKNLNVGVTVWHRYKGSQEEAGDFWGHYIGYARIGRKWGLALSTASGNVHADDVEESEEWLFNDAPRWLRLEALDHIPELLEHLVKKANEVAEALQKKTAQTRELASTISTLSGSKSSTLVRR